MNARSIDETRVQLLNDTDVKKGGYVLYWMQQSQRVEYNHALEYAIQEADRLRQPVVVVFGLTPHYPDANLRHYAFMLEGLKETRSALADRGVQMAVRLGRPDTAALEMGKEASLIVCDRGYLRHQKIWRQQVALKAGCRVVQVESDVVVPVETASAKADYAARTIRPRIHRQLERYLVPFQNSCPAKSSLGMGFEKAEIQDIQSSLYNMRMDLTVPPVGNHFMGGTHPAQKRFHHFLKTIMGRYDQNSNQPQTDDISGMSPYLHFGQISPLWLALKVREVEKEMPADAAAYLEQLIIRRELSMNFVHYTPNYDRFEALPGWAQKTLAEHRGDRREYLYSHEELEKAQTHDPYWNAAMKEMIHTGYMHNYMRMYWGKKVLEWSRIPEMAFQTLLRLNNKYFLDGRDPNSYTGVMWIFGLHDRAWGERPVFGKIRYMAASGLERKCDIMAYVEKVERLAGLKAEG
jgi:deoxyribodipyrimidine photo-lyase